MDTPVSSLMPARSKQWIPNSFSPPVSSKDFSTVRTTLGAVGCGYLLPLPVVPSLLLGYSHCCSSPPLTAHLPLLQGSLLQLTLSNHWAPAFFYAERSGLTPQPWFKAAVFNQVHPCVCYRTHRSPTTSALPTALISSWWTRTSSVSYPQKEVSFPHLLQILGEPSLPLLPGNGSSVKGILWKQCRQNMACWNKVNQVENTSTLPSVCACYIGVVMQCLVKVISNYKKLQKFEMCNHL